MEELIQTLVTTIEKLEERQCCIEEFLQAVLADYANVADEELFRNKYSSQYEEIAPLFGEEDGLGKLYAKHKMYSNEPRFEELFGSPYDADSYIAKCFEEAKEALAKAEVAAAEGEAPAEGEVPAPSDVPPEPPAEEPPAEDDGISDLPEEQGVYV